MAATVRVSQTLSSGGRRNSAIFFKVALTSANQRAYTSTGGHGRQQPAEDQAAGRPSCKTSKTPGAATPGAESPGVRALRRGADPMRHSAAAVLRERGCNSGRTVGRASPCRGYLTNRTAMIRPVSSSSLGWLLALRRPLARSGPELGALSRQLSALERRRRLREQQQEVQSGAADSLAIPPYPYRPRPPS